MTMFRIVSPDNTRVIVMKLWRKIMVVLKSGLIPHYWYQRSSLGKMLVEGVKIIRSLI